MSTVIKMLATFALATVVFGGVASGEADDSGSGFESGEATTTFAPTALPTTLPTTFPTSNPTALPTTLPTRFPTTPAPVKDYKISKFGCVDKLLPIETVAECEEAARALDFVFDSARLDTQPRRSKRPAFCYVNTASSDEDIMFNTKGKLSGYVRDYTSICVVDSTQVGGPDCVDTMLGCNALVKYGFCNYRTGQAKCAFTCGCKDVE
eukprot:m.108233 g.108233  ORF g.108233 m.108233 type:complete len:208 (+) comp27856_c0_seq1:101-724(+)